MGQMNAVVAAYGTLLQAREARRAFQGSGFDMKRVSIVGHDGRNTAELAGLGSLWGVFWDNLRTMALGSAVLFIPGLATLGPLVGWIVGPDEGAVLGGMTALGGALDSIGLPETSILSCQRALKADQIAVVAHGSPAEGTTATRILVRTGPLCFDQH